MKTLMIMRHADAETAAAGEIKDFDRTLTEEGREKMASLAEELADMGLMPDHIFCSAAKRTKQTLEALFPDFSEKKVEYRKDMYETSAGNLYQMIKLVDGNPNTVLFIGHNPDIHAFALFLTNPTHKSTDFSDFSLQFAPGTIAILECKSDSWISIMPGDNRLIKLIRAKKDLPASKRAL